MSNPTQNIDRALRRHLDQATWLLNNGYPALALEVALAALRHEPLSTESDLLRFLVSTLLPMAADARHPSHRALNVHLQDHPSRRGEARRLTEYCLGEVQRVQCPTRIQRIPGPDQLRTIITALDHPHQEGAGRPRPVLSLPAGCARGVVLDPPETVWVFAQPPRVGPAAPHERADFAVPGLQEALAAANEYLAEAGCDTATDVKMDVLVTGLFRAVEGESLSLPIFMAAVSSRLGVPLPGDWAFTGVVGRSGSTLPVDRLAEKVHVCLEAGCSTLMIPSQARPTDSEADGERRLTVLEVTEAADGVERALPQHRLAAAPRAASWTEVVKSALRGTLSPGHQVKLSGAERPHLAFRWFVPLFFSLLTTERWLLGDYLVPEYYQGVSRPTASLTCLVGILAGALVFLTVRGALELPDRLLDRGAIADWWLLAAWLCAGHLIAWALIQFLIRDPLAPPPRGLFLEHRSLQSWKDNLVSLAFAAIFFVSPYTRMRLTARTRATGRRRWADEILRGGRWARAYFPVTRACSLAVIAAIALMGLGGLDWLSLFDPNRAGAGPWRSAHIVCKSSLYLVSVILGLWWVHRHSARVDPEA